MWVSHAPPVIIKLEKWFINPINYISFQKPYSYWGYNYQLCYPRGAHFVANSSYFVVRSLAVSAGSFHVAVKQGEGRTTRLLGPVYLMNFTKHDDTVGGYVEDTKYNFGIFSSAYYLDFRQASIGYTVYIICVKLDMRIGKHVVSMRYKTFKGSYSDI